ncbi:hypothetical protein [Weissella thailandensis]|uniref:Phage protein n=1 Tax=Weissella thailandensis TaxID=89061 RepID=A0ABX9I6U8_9LACO|nr:hypothetical protein [Weissella thailandensis]NKY90331.1 hypothetical protein [Weissella thailandensis]RDS60440.1 hypothetical protein DWV05_00620 [Weissella thailandensis]GEP75615.1 hypothetical protein WTH01_18620 [Weissella thailandensis]
MSENELQAMETKLPEIYTNDGEIIPVTQLTEKDFENMDDRTLEEVNYMFKIASKAQKTAKKVIDKRLKDGHTFSRYVYKKRKIDKFDDDNNDFKEELVEKYGFDAVKVKTPNKLREKFGDVVNKDIEPHLVHGETNYATFE